MNFHLAQLILNVTVLINRRVIYLQFALIIAIIVKPKNKSLW